MGYGLFGTTVGNRNSLFLLLGLLLVNATSSFTSWCEPAFAAPTKHAGRHGRYYVTRGRGWRCFELHLALYNITAQALEQRLGISSFETYLVRRRLRWLGHVRRMPWHRLPRKLLTSWVSSPRMAGGQEMTYGRATGPRSRWC